MGFDSSQLLRAVLNSVDAAILMVDKNLKVIMCNRKFEDFFGITPSLIINQDKKEAITRDIKWRVQDPEEFQQRLFLLYDNPEIISNDEVVVELPRRRILNRFSGPVFDENRKLLGRVEVYYDITRAKDLQREFEFKNDQLFLLNAAATAISQSLEVHKLCNYFLRRVIQATNCSSGLIYLQKDKELEMARGMGEIEKPGEIKKMLIPDDWNTISWGMIGDNQQSIFLEKVKDKGFYIAFPAYGNQNQINGLCILIWDKLSEQWLNRSLFENVGIYLGVGIRNADLYKEAQRIAILQERDRIAMEMHDGLAQTLSYLGLGIDSLSDRIYEGKINQECFVLLARLREVIDNSYVDVREAIIGLRIEVSDELGLFKALEEYIKEFQILTKIDVRLEVCGEREDPSFEDQLHIIRIVQEALTNVRRHSKATKALISFDFVGDDLKIIIEDNGEGFVRQTKDDNMSLLHQGIRIMNMRTNLLGGILDIESVKGKGTKVFLKIPLKKEVS